MGQRDEQFDGSDGLPLVDGWERFTSPAGVVAAFRRVPATFALLAPYALLVVPAAVAFGNPDLWFLLGVVSIALAGTLLPELIILKKARRAYPTNNIAHYGPGLFKLAVLAIAVGSCVGLAAAYAGKGSVAVQTGLAEASPGIVGTVDSLIRGWVLVGVGLLFAAYLGGQCTRRAVFVVLLIPVLAEAASIYFTQLTAPLLELVTFLAMMMLLLGVVKTRVVVIGVLVTLFVWPAIFQIRNDLRMAQGVQVSETVTAFDRLRFDVQFARAAELPTPLNIDVPGLLLHPTPLDMLRFGIVPRVLDPDRPRVSTGQVLNVALGGSSTSAYTFGPVNTAYVLEGPVYLFLYYFLLAALLSRIWKRGMRVTPTRLVLLALILSGPLGWFSTFPDTVMTMLQNLVSALPILGILPILRAARRREMSTSRPGVRS